MNIVDDLIKGREAFDRRDWPEARSRLSIADLDALDADDLHDLAVASYLVGDGDASVRAWQRSFRLHLDTGATLAAIGEALWIAFVLVTAGNESAGSGWVARATRMLEDESVDVVERGYLGIHLTYRYIADGRWDKAFELASEVTASGRRFRDADLVAQGLSSQGRLLTHAGRVPEGLALLDEAMVGVTAGEVSPIMAGLVYCSMIEGCQEVGDLRRMVDWTDALSRWCEAQPGLVRFTGQCALHRAQIMRAQGAYSEALEELDLALARYEATGLDPACGLALYERGEVLRVCGDYDAATGAYDAAAAFGHEPQPGLCLLWLARGRTLGSLRAVHRLLDETIDPIGQSRLRPAAVEVLVAAGETEAAELAAVELESFAASIGCAELEARASYARGTLELIRLDPASALPAFRRSWALWIELGARYDAARARSRIGLALRALGDEDSAVSEMADARRTFAELGAVPAEREISRLAAPSYPDGLTDREVQVLRLVAAGQGNQQIATTLVLSEKTVARHLSNIFGKTDVSTRTAAAAYAFEHDIISRR